jgi:hypothetical protein
VRRILAGALLSLLVAASAAAQVEPIESAGNALRIEALVSPVTVRLRGLSAVDENIDWASGREGTVIRTIDAGKTWSVFKVPGAEKLDFRDVEGFSADEAAILSIGPGEDSRVYRTSDGGRTWVLVLRNTNPKAFFDCFDFGGDVEGWMLGDPVDGRFQVYWTGDAGGHWQLLSDAPEAAKGESAFAASGTCIHVSPSGDVAIATGGSRARVLVSYLDQDRLNGSDKQRPPVTRWLDASVAMPAGAESRGVFGLAAFNEQFLAVGGDFKQEAESAATTFVFASESGLRAFAAPPTPGYRSGVACSVDQEVCIATGPGGVGLLKTSSWQAIGSTGYDSVDSAGRVFWFSGDDGRVGRLVLPGPVSP